LVVRTAVDWVTGLRIVRSWKPSRTSKHRTSAERTTWLLERLTGKGRSVKALRSTKKDALSLNSQGFLWSKNSSNNDNVIGSCHILFCSFFYKSRFVLLTASLITDEYLLLFQSLTFMMGGCTIRLPTSKHLSETFKYLGSILNAKGGCELRPSGSAVTGSSRKDRLSKALLSLPSHSLLYLCVRPRCHA